VVEHETEEMNKRSLRKTSHNTNFAVIELELPYSENQQHIFVLCKRLISRPRRQVIYANPKQKPEFLLEDSWRTKSRELSGIF